MIIAGNRIGVNMIDNGGIKCPSILFIIINVNPIPVTIIFSLFMSRVVVGFRLLATND